jgi:hypothetical protein
VNVIARSDDRATTTTTQQQQQQQQQQRMATTARQPAQIIAIRPSSTRSLSIISSL